MKQNNKKNLKVLYLPDYFFYNELELIQLGRRPWSFYTYTIYNAKRFSIDADVLSIGDRIPRLLPKWLIKYFYPVKSILQAVQALFVLHKYDIVLAWRGTAIVLLIIRWFIRWKKPKVIFITWRPFNTRLTGLRYRVAHFMARRISSVADRILCVSTLQEEVFPEILKIPKKKVTFFPLGVDSNFFKPENGEKTETFLLSVGSADRDDKLLLKLINDLPGVKLVSTKKGVFEVKHPKYNKEQGEKIGDEIRVLNVSFKQLRDLYEKCMFVVIPILPTSDQPAGLTSLLEAMAMGKAVIIGKGLATHDYVVDRESGVLVAPGEFKHLKDSILRLIDNKEVRNKIGRNARKRVEDKFTLEKCSKSFGEIIWGVYKGEIIK